MTLNFTKISQKAQAEAISKLLFDYSTIDAAVRKEAQAAAVRINANRSNARLAIFEVGKDLRAIKDKLPHGQFLPWIEKEFGMTDRTARNYMAAWQMYSENPDEAVLLDPTALYALTAPSTPPEIKAEVLEQVKAGNIPSPKEIRAKIAAEKPAKAKLALKLVEPAPEQPKLDDRKIAASAALSILENNLNPQTLRDFTKLALQAEDELLTILSTLTSKAEAA